MRRRDFIAGIAGSAAAWPLAARSQQSERVRRIGVLMHLAANDPEGQRRLAAFQQGLREAGWTIGRNVTIDARWAAAVLFVWMIPVTLLYHNFWAAEPAQLFNQTNHFMKNLAIMGALLHLAGMGPGPLSLRDEQCAGDNGGAAA